MRFLGGHCACSQLSSAIWTELERHFTSSDAIGGQLDAATLVPILVMTAHFSIFSLVTVLGTLALSLAATRNVCVHLLFYFQFFVHRPTIRTAHRKTG